MENDMIRRSDVIQALDELLNSPYARQDPFGFAVRDALKLVRDMMNGDVPKSFSIPAVDAVERAVYEQVVWERDLAVKQLADIGKGLGEKMDDVAKVVRCRECKRWERLEFSPLHFCPEVHEFTYAEFFCKRGKRREDGDTMPRLIDAEALGVTDFEIVLCGGDYKELCKTLIAKVESAPTIDAVPVVHGEWGIARQMGFDILYCSACGEPLNCNDHGEYYKKKMRFCPFCGARMDGRREDGDA